VALKATFLEHSDANGFGHPFEPEGYLMKYFTNGSAPAWERS
jgi:hypothetical protein